MGDILAALILALYRIAGFVFRPLVPLLISARVAQGKEDRARTGERYGHASRPRPPGRLIWVHAASVGETNAVLPLIARLTGEGFQVVFTSTTLTSANIAAARLPKGAFHQFGPVDITPYVDRFLEYWKPELAIFVESELWPMIIRRLERHTIPLVVVNARLSERSFRGWRRFGGTADALFGKIALCLAQSEQDAAHFAALGARHVSVSGNLKFDAPPLVADLREVERMTTAIGGRPVWIAASTHEGEEAIVASAHRVLRERYPQMLTIIIPRHPERGAAVRATLAAERLAVAQRSRGEPLLREIDVYLADTLDEMGLFYRLAPIAFLGGSLTPNGGHNPIEPARLDVAVLHGPHVHNFAGLFARIDHACPAKALVSAGDLAAAVGALLADPAATKVRAAATLAALAPLSGALDVTMQKLRPYLDGPRLIP